MKEWKLRVLIGFSFISIAGLMLVQLYWMRDALDISETHFRQKVDQAMTNVVWNLERVAVVKEEQLRNEQLRRNRAQLKLLDSLQQLQMSDTAVPFPSLFSGTGLYRFYDNDEEYYHVPPAQINGIIDTLPVHEHQYTDETVVGETPQQRYAQYNDSLLDFISQSLRKQDQYMYIRGYLEDIFQEGSFVAYRDHLDDLLDSAYLAEMITDELENAGIRNSFEYAVYSPVTGKLLFDAPKLAENIPGTGNYTYNLFPNFKLAQPVHLIITFPEEKQYLFSHLGKVMPLSVILIVILTWSLYFIARNAFRQKKLGEMKNDFINNMTHEFKTPVSTISLACEALRDTDIEKSGPMLENYLKIIDEENKRLGKLAEQILQTAIIDKGHLYLLFEKVDLHELTQKVIEKYQPVIELSNGTVRTKLFADNPVVSGDKTHLHNMLSNLVDNAIKYSADKVFVEILTTCTPDQVTLSIQDRGIGITKANQKKIFDKLYRVPTGNLHNSKGFGLGLSYVKYVVERHGGSVHVESELNKGSRFIVSLPRNADRTNQHHRI